MKKILKKIEQIVCLTFLEFPDLPSLRDKHLHYPKLTARTYLALSNTTDKCRQRSRVHQKIPRKAITSAVAVAAYFRHLPDGIRVKEIQQQKQRV